MTTEASPASGPVPTKSGAKLPARANVWPQVNTSLDHLPESKREQLKAIASVIRSRAPVDMVILFGSYARGNWVEDLATGYFSDFDLMAVVATPEQAKDAVLWGEITAEIRRLSGRTPVTLVVHDVKELNHEIRMGQFFFADVVKEGILLYDSKHFILAKPKALTAEERIKLALYNFDYWFHSASEFWRGSVYYAGRGLGPHSAFLLHQAAERYFHAMLLVYTGYKPRTHDLEELAEKTAPLHPAMEGALPRIEENDKHHFDLLKRAYIEARYSKAYRVTSAELEVMRAHVLDLASRVRTACAKQISVMSPTGEIPELSAMPAVTDVSALPELPDLGDSKAVNAWREAVAQMSEERAEKSYEAGRQEERARAIVEVLRRRGIPLTDEQAQKIADCRDQATLTHWWDRAWSVSSADEL